MGRMSHDEKRMPLERGVDESLVVVAILVENCGNVKEGYCVEKPRV